MNKHFLNRKPVTRGRQNTRKDAETITKQRDNN